MKSIRHWHWKHIGRQFAVYLAICLPLSWLESHCWLEKPYSAVSVIFKGLFMAVWFTILFAFVFSRAYKHGKQVTKINLPHES